MAWSGYLSALPGALLPIAAVVRWPRGRVGTPSLAVAGLTAVGALAGLASAQVVICDSVMYCGA